MSDDILLRLMAVLQSRKGADPDSSYVAGLYARGLDTILKKIGEESTETIIAAKSGDKEQIIYETADLWFHCLVMLAQQNLDARLVLEELDRRFGVSGIDEKAAEFAEHALVEIVLGEHASAPTIARLEHNRRRAGGLQTVGRGQPGDATADDDCNTRRLVIAED